MSSLMSRHIRCVVEYITIACDPNVANCVSAAKRCRATRLTILTVLISPTSVTTIVCSRSGNACCDAKAAQVTPGISQNVSAGIQSLACGCVK